MDIKDKIENLVRLKKRNKVRYLSSAYLRSNNYSRDSIFIVSQWYRRLSLYKEGFRLLTMLNPFEPIAAPEVKLRTAEFLSILGANPFAISLIEKIALNNSDDYEVAAGIFFAANEYKSALECFEKRISLLNNHISYESRLSRLSCADCLAQLNEIEKAIEICKQLLIESSEPLFIAICKQAMGEYLSRANRPKDAISWLIAATNSFPGKKESYDHALLYRWLGYTYAKLKKTSLAKKNFIISTKIIKKIGLREEIWLENLSYQAELGLLNKQEKLRILFYPRAKNTTLNIDLKLGSAKALIKINPTANEYTYKNRTYIGLPLELQLLSKLRIAEDWGIGVELLKVILWPNEANSYIQLDARLLQLAHRLKSVYKLSIYFKNKRLYLKKNHFNKVSVYQTQSTNILEKLSNKFTAKDFRKMYQLKKTQSVKLINKYILEGRIYRHINGAHTYYTKRPSG